MEAPSPHAGHLTEAGRSRHTAWWSGHTYDQAERYARQSITETAGPVDIEFVERRVDPRCATGVQVRAVWFETGPEAAKRRGLIR